jgi:phosphohistidine phosphatase
MLRSRNFPAPQNVAMIRLYLVRHAIAEELPDGQRFADPMRALTAKGRRRFRRSARAFAEMGEEVDVICTSPLLRAVQTAEVLAAALRHDEVKVLDELLPESAVPPLLLRLAELGAQSAALVGHKRLLCDLAGTLAGLPVEDTARLRLEDTARLRLKRGTIVRIDVRKLSANAMARPRWWLGPEAGPLRDGLPLEETG